MAVKMRWVQYDVNASGSAGDGNGNGCVGTQGYCRAVASVNDTFSISEITNRLYINIDGESGPYITLYVGDNLDPRFVAKDITEKLHDLGKVSDAWNQAKCVWTNNKSVGNCFEIYSGTLGSSSSVVVLTGGTYSADSVLGFSTNIAVGGAASTNGFGGDISIEGDYYGFLSETYKIVISNDTYAEAVSAPRGIGAPVKYAANTYDGVMSLAGVFSHSSDITYSIAINTVNGSTVGGGTGNVPLMSWVSTGSDSSVEDTELLYSNYWYKIGDHGLMVSFSDAVFSTASPAWAIECKKADYVGGTNSSAPVGIAQYVYSSDRGDNCVTPILTSSGTPTQLGSRGLSIKFNPSSALDSFNAGDTFYVTCSGPQPQSYNITSLNYGNVTVSTEATPKCIVFELESGAVELVTVAMGLINHGTFENHQEGDFDTMFRFGTVGVGNKAGIGSASGIEWYPGITAADLDNDIPPSYLFHTVANLSVVASADESEPVGTNGLMSDPVWLSFKLGSNETGANSGIKHRCYYDYS